MERLGYYNKNKYLLSIVLLLTFTSCTQQQNPRLDIHHMPEQVPKSVQARFAWALFKLDLPVIKETLTAGAQPYTLETVVDVKEVIPQGKLLSPFALLLEGYLARIYMVEDLEQISAALDRMYACVEFLIQQNISVDRGVTTLAGDPTMREFVRDSIVHLNQEKEGFLDGEGIHALQTLKKIQKLIDEKQRRAKMLCM